MKHTILLITLIAAHILNVSAASSHQDAIQSYRKQYTAIVSSINTSTNVVDRIILKQKLEQLKQTNLHLFKQSK